MFFLSAELNIFEKYQQFYEKYQHQQYQHYETFHCAHYVAYHVTKYFKENGILDLKLVFHTGILLHYFTFFIPNSCMETRRKMKTQVSNYFCIGNLFYNHCLAFCQFGKAFNLNAVFFTTTKLITS